ncbi:hypothetical protein D8780_09755 [Notoacmeibacter ruber]|uniref:Uncharacterized protein n=1 Tax=Notoacmeibacter ruber TaxID=2670375 RepID=A0A3L7JCC9_9HYPH|nr:hypothetical protein D8780_09755 [Notoacmeibacter ruber]
MRLLSVWTGALLIVLSIATFDANLLYPSFFALIPTLGTALFIFAGVNANSASQDILQRF